MTVSTRVRVKPFFGRVAVAPSPVDQYQEASGLIIPFAEDPSHLKRGVVTDIDMVYEEAYPEYPFGEMLQPGTVVWYTSGVRVGDVEIVEAKNIYAYEENVG